MVAAFNEELTSFCTTMENDDATCNGQKNYRRVQRYSSCSTNGFERERIISDEGMCTADIQDNVLHIKY